MITPMLRHYVELKAKHAERVLLYRDGAFFECFFEDAVERSRLLELNITGKEAGKAIGWCRLRAFTITQPSAIALN